jgi:ribosomal protein S18 acetylase RimI-like enzyme
VSGLQVDSFLHLSLRLDAAAEAAAPQMQDCVTDGWRHGDIARAAALLEAAYSPDAARYFAPNGTLDEWHRYVATMVNQAPCGVLDASLTRVVRDGDRLQALALVTFMSPSTAHLAQLAISPEWRRRGRARHLVREVQSLAVQAGFQQLTLLVARSNDPARRLYESLGFSQG